MALVEPVGSSFLAEVYFVSPHTSTVITGLIVSLKEDKLERIRFKRDNIDVARKI